MDEKLRRLARELGAEAEENHFELPEYYEDFCLQLGVEKWRDIPGSIKAEIIKEFKVGIQENKQARMLFR